MPASPRPFDFQAEDDQIWILMGAVDSGRRELIRTIAGLARPRAGRVELFGHDIERLWPWTATRLRRQIGVALERPGLVPAWSVFENLALLVRCHGLAPAGEVEDYVVNFLESCRLPAALLTRRASELSPLESRWIGLLRALIIQPKLLLLSTYLPPETLTAGYDAWTFFAEKVRPMRMTILVDAGPQALPIGAETCIMVMERGALLAAGRVNALMDHPDSRVRRYVRSGHA